MNTRLDEHKDDPREVRSSKHNSVREIKQDSSTEKRFTGGKLYSTSSHKTEIDKKKTTQMLKSEMEIEEVNLS